MAEYSKKKLFWIKLSQDFMTSDTVDFLMEQKDGANYVVLYQMLCLKTINNNGELSRQLGEIIVPYDIEKIQRETKWFTVDTIRIALELFKKLGLIYENQNGCLAISNFDRLLGWTTVGAEKKQLQLAKREGGKLGGTKVEKIPPYKDIDKDIDSLLINKIDSKNARTHEEDVDNSIFAAFKEKFKKFYEYQKTPQYIQIADDVIYCLVDLSRKEELAYKGETYTHEEIEEIINKLDLDFFIKIISTISLKGNIENKTYYVWGMLFNQFEGVANG